MTATEAKETITMLQNTPLFKGEYNPNEHSIDYMFGILQTIDRIALEVSFDFMNEVHNNFIHKMLETKNKG